jgi:hypothetical protein
VDLYSGITKGSPHDVDPQGGDRKSVATMEEPFIKNSKTDSVRGRSDIASRDRGGAQPELRADTESETCSCHLTGHGIATATSLPSNRGG